MSSAIEFAVAVLLAAGAVWFTLQPVLRPGAAALLGAGDAAGDDEDDGAEDMRPRAVALRALREIEFDRATGKLADADYEALKAKYTAEALTALRADEAGARESSAPAAQRAPAVAGLSRTPGPACPVHGPRAEPGAEYCAECGRPLVARAGYCSGCGAELAEHASFCNACGTRVAA